MSPRRPPRPWLGTPGPVDPEGLVGPRGLTPEVLAGDDGPPAEDAISILRGSRAPPNGDFITPPRHDPAFYWSLLTPERQARIQSVVEARLQSVTVLLDRLLDPHNTAAILRTAEGLGLCAAHVVPHEKGDAVAHRRVTQDAHKWLDIEQHESGAKAAEALRAGGFAVWAGHLDARAIDYADLPADRPLALLFGNEHDGPSAETLAACDGAFRIPMAGFAQSFNVSVAAGVALASLTRRRREFLGRPGDLTEQARVELRDRFTLLAAKLARRTMK